MQSVKIYGLANSDSTRDARRYFREYDIPVRFTDLTNSAIAGTELSAFLSAFPLASLIDTDSPAYAALIANRDTVPDSELLSQINVTPSLLRLPFVRGGSRLAIGYDENRWRAIVSGLSSKG